MPNAAWNNRTFPYPLLGPPNGDYQDDISFGVELTETIEVDQFNANLTFRYILNSQYITNLIAGRLGTVHTHSRLRDH